MATQQHGANEERELGYTRLVPEDADQLLDKDIFEVYLVQVKSNSDIGKEDLNDPLRFLRERTDIKIGDSDVHAQVLRVNAEVPANPVRRSTVWMIYPGSTNAVGVQYKYQHSDS